MKYRQFLGVLLLAMAIAFTNPGNRQVAGVVSDDAGNPVAHATVQVKGTAASTFTDVLGWFRIRLNSDQAVLVITAVGYETRELKPGRQSTLKIQLKKNARQAEETVVAGWSGAVTMPLQARVAGLSANRGTIMIRGTGAGDLSYERKQYNREGYDYIGENPFLPVAGNPLSTFSIDVDAASYSNIRRMLNSGQLPPQGAVRIEEMINYFSYEYDQPRNGLPFTVHTEMAVCPWNSSHRLVLIGLQGRRIDATALPPSNLTFLIDVSGSMFSEDKLPLVKASLKLLVDQLRPVDKVSIVVYAGNAGLVLPATGGENKMAIKEAIDRLEAGGSTAGGAGIELAYKVARENFNKEGNNRVILCTDGDFNVGASSDDALERMIEEERKSGVYLTVLGYGTGNYQDAKMQKLADKGNGNHAYIDGLSEAKKVLINEFGGTLFTIAKDVKLQVEFNPAKVQAYRLIGYENRMLAKEDFNNDQKDAGDMGSGHTVTALYELVPPGVELPDSISVDALRYQQVKPNKKESPDSYTDEMMLVKLRYKDPGQDKSRLLSVPVKGIAVAVEKASGNFRFAASVACFGMLLRDSKYKGIASYSFAKSLAKGALGKDTEGYRKEMVQLIDKADVLSDKDNIAKKN